MALDTSVVRTADALDRHLARLDAQADQLRADLDAASLAERIATARKEAKGVHVGACSSAALKKLAFQADVLRWVDKSKYQGLNQYKGQALDRPNDCGWSFQGYALPIFDPPENRDFWGSTVCGTDPNSWFPNLPYHVDTTSTSTVYLKDKCTWRLYFPNPKVKPDDRDVEEYPSNHSSDATLTGMTYPDAAAWAAQPQFQTGRICFVDSPDGGETFPVYAPTMIPTSLIDDAVSLPSDTTTCPGWVVASWDQAGWTTTAIPSETSPGISFKDSNGHYFKYHDITVIDLYAEYGWYLMVAVECRSASAGGGDTCCTTSCDGVSNGFPYTRVVLFACESPDFQDVIPVPDITADGATRDLMVLLEPDVGGGGPGSGDPNEWYGVPTAILTEDKGTLLLYVQWYGNVPAPGVPIIPTRVAERYPEEDDYRAALDPTLPYWYNNQATGVSCFAIPTSSLDVLVRMMALVRDGAYSSATGEAWVALAQVQMQDNWYLGELLITDGSLDHFYPMGGTDYEVPRMIMPIIDPHVIYIDSELYIYWDQQHDSATNPRSSDNDQLYRAHSASRIEIELVAGLDLTKCLEPNQDYSTFLSTETCDFAFDMRDLLEATATAWSSWGSHGRLANDPDVVVLRDGQMRCTYSGGGPDAACGAGLIYALTEGPTVPRSLPTQGRRR